MLILIHQLLDLIKHEMLATAPVLSLIVLKAKDKAIKQHTVWLPH
jgi:hypothetical protein